MDPNNVVIYMTGLYTPKCDHLVIREFKLLDKLNNKNPKNYGVGVIRDENGNFRYALCIDIEDISEEGIEKNIRHAIYEQCYKKGPGKYLIVTGSYALSDARTVLYDTYASDVKPKETIQIDSLSNEKNFLIAIENKERERSEFFEDVKKRVGEIIKGS